MRTRTTITAAAALVLAACTVERPADIPSAPSAAVAAAPTGGTTCDFSRTKSDARAYFASSNDEIFTIIGDLQSLYKAGPTTSATLNKGFDGLDRIARARTTAGALKSTATSTQGAAVASDLFLCMPITGPSTARLDSALGTGGLFAVRGGATDTRTNGVYSYNRTPAWGAQPSSGTWAKAPKVDGTRFLLYGFPINSFNPSDPLVTTTYAYEFSTAPSGIEFDPKLIIGTCPDASTQTSNPHIQHSNTVLALVSLACAPQDVASADAMSPMSRTLRTLGRFLLPTPAYAKMFASGFGGLGGNLSPYAAIEATSFKVTITGQPLDGYVNTPIPGTSDSGFVEVSVTTGGGTPVEGANVYLNVVGNSGSFTPKDTAAVTGANGRVNLRTFQLDKAGGYTISAKAIFDGVTTPASAPSTMFNLKNKTAP